MESARTLAYQERADNRIKAKRFGRFGLHARILCAIWNACH